MYSFPNFEPVPASCPILTVASRPAYRFLRRQVRWAGVPISLRIFHSYDPHNQMLYCSQWSRIDVFFLNSLAFSVIQRMLAIWSLVPLPFLNPTCISGGSQFTYCWSLAWRILIFAYGSLIMNWYLHSTVHQKITSRQKSYLYQCCENIACNNCLVTFYSGDTNEN